MFYDFAFTIPAGTPEADPHVEELKLDKGVIHYIEVSMPKGCKGYVFVKLTHNESPLAPSNHNGYFCGDGYTIPVNEHYVLSTEPLFIKAIGYSPDATYDHTLPIRVGLLKEDELEPLKDLPQQFQDFFKLFSIGG